MSSAQYARRRRAGRCVECGKPELGPGAIRCVTCPVSHRYDFGRPPPEKLPEGMKRCRKCRVILPADTTHFYARAQNADGLQGHCRNCERKVDRERQARLLKQTELTRGRHCGVCMGLSWHVVGPACRHCGLAAAPEAPLDLAEYALRREWRGANP